MRALTKDIRRNFPTISMNNSTNNLPNSHEQSQTWLLNHLRWEGFGSIAGILGSVLISADAGYAIAYALTFCTFAYYPSQLYNWFAANLNFVQVLVLSVALGVLSIIEPRVLMQNISKELVEGGDRHGWISRLLRIRNVLAVYVFSMSFVCVVVYIVLNVLGRQGLG